MLARKVGAVTFAGFALVLSAGCDLGTYGQRVDQAGTSFKPDVAAQAGDADGEQVAQPAKPQPVKPQGSGSAKK